MTPLIADYAPDAPLLWRRAGLLSQREFVATVTAHAQQLAPLCGQSSAPIVNLCVGRETFMTAFCALALNGTSNLLASDPAAATLASLKATLPGLRAIGDDSRRTDLDYLLDRLLAIDSTTVPLPTLLASSQVALPFTSGSTGAPIAHPKTVGGTRATAVATCTRLFSAWPRFAVVATVPSQHMYGLETTLQLALTGRALVSVEQPLLPGDVAAALAALPRPRVLVTTPVHLRALMRWRGSLPPADGVVSATAPLAVELAAQAEASFGCPLHEIYGCTEAGSLATRRTVAEQTWTLLDGFRIAAVGAPEEQSAQVVSDWLPMPVILPDRVECADAQRFDLLGRRDDMVNIGGKRASLARLLQLLLGVPGVIDAHLYLRDNRHDAARDRLAGLVVTDGRDERAVLAAFAQRIDPVFLPRPLTRVDAIPRNATGKLTEAALQAVIAANP